MTATTKPVHNLVTVTVPTRHDSDTPIIPVVVAGEPIAPGLLITPALALNPPSYRGGWTVTHQPSGRAVSGAVGFACIDCIRHAAKHLTDAPVDWTRGMDDVITDPAAIQAVSAFVNAAHLCNGHGCGTGRF